MDCENIINKKLAVIGLGYVGLPLSVAFSSCMETVGFDISSERINHLKKGFDVTQEVSPEVLKSSDNLVFTKSSQLIQNADIYIITVPTPIDDYKKPDLSALRSASATVGGSMSKGCVVVYESTVYPGATEEVCVPILERESGLKFNQDFFVGYSPERLNPGDKERTVVNTLKITSGSTAEAASFVDKLYQLIVEAGTYPVSSIKVAEAAKVIENTQRDLNIALVNELAIIFNELNINTHEVIQAAATKWNFMAYTPGLVGGHCIGVDPYYLTYKAQEIGYHPDVILAGRRINDSMAHYVASQVVKKMMKRGIDTLKAKVLILGLTFKENCPDIRNSKVVDVISELADYGVRVDVYDPWVDSAEAQDMYGLSLLKTVDKGQYDGIVLAVGHQVFKQLGLMGVREYGVKTHVLYDVKSMFVGEEVEGHL